MLTIVSSLPVQTQEFSKRVNDAFNSIRFFKISDQDGWTAVHNVSLAAFLSAPSAAEARRLLEVNILQFLQEVGDQADWLLSIPPLGKQGFAIDLSQNNGRFRVMFGELEEDCETLSEALAWISRALSDSYQMRITLVGGRAREWTLEPTSPASNEPSLASGDVILFRSMRDTKHVVLRNSFRT